MDTLLLHDTNKDIEEAASIVAAGGLIGFPTETVYGLGADALNSEAVSKVYKAKGRPSDNPMIVHISSKTDILKLTKAVTSDMEKLINAFWPGPLTMVVNRREIVPDVTTGGLDTVGIRMPDNRVALELIKESGCPIAAPSANLSGKPSPTTAQHVIDDLYGRIDGIIVSTPCRVGIESSVIDMTSETPMILRPGIITKEQFENVLGKEVLLDPTLNKRPDQYNNNEEFKPKAPGMKYKHYAPKAQMVIYEGKTKDVSEAINKEKCNREKEGQKVCVIIWDDSQQEEAAHDFFRKLRAADKENVDVILARAMTENGVGFSVMNRMLKSAGYNIVNI